MSEMIDCVAEAISDELSLHKQSLDWTDPDGPIQRAARAAIKAMRKPTAEMIKAGWGESLPAGIWSEMIDEALKG